MKTNFKNFLIMAILMLATMTSWAIGVQDPPPEGGITAGWLLTTLAPLITLGVTYLIRLAKPLIPAWATVLVVAGLSTAVTWIADLLGALGDVSFFEQFVYGLLSIVINQFYRAFTGGNAAHARTK